MRAEIVAIGTELLLGEITDTNTPFIARELASLGIDLYFASTVGDNYERLVGVLRVAWGRSDITFTTGGLGPSQGDVTRFAIAGLLGEEPYVDTALKQNLVDMFQKRGLEMTPNNIKQATLIPSATAILNPRGTAPGWWVDKEGRIIVAMPGPPGEMQVMWYNGVLPRLKAKSDSIILSRTLKTSGLSESKIDDVLSPFAKSSNPTLATYAKADGIHVRITAKAQVLREAEEMIASREGEVRSVLGDSIWGTDSDTLESVIGRLLTAKGLTLAVAESFGGGLLINSLANVPASNAFFGGGIVTSSDEARIALGVDAQLIAKQDVVRIAEEMAYLVRSRFNASMGIALHGESPADSNSVCRLVIAIDDASTGRHTQVYTQEFNRLAARANQYAFIELRKALR
jgi:nicotinamide-nucleotide amidase